MRCSNGSVRCPHSPRHSRHVPPRSFRAESAQRGISLALFRTAQFGGSVGPLITSPHVIPSGVCVARNPSCFSTATSRSIMGTPKRIIDPFFLDTDITVWYSTAVDICAWRTDPHASRSLRPPSRKSDLSPLFSALTRKRAISPIISTLTQQATSKSNHFHTYTKKGGWGGEACSINHCGFAGACARPFHWPPRPSQ
jgi:hypothetical protein